MNNKGVEREGIGGGERKGKRLRAWCVFRRGFPAFLDDKIKDRKILPLH